MLCVLPMLGAALLFSEAGGVVATCCLPEVSPAVDKGAKGDTVLSACMPEKTVSPFAILSAVLLNPGQKPLHREVCVLVGVFLLKPRVWENENCFLAH